MLMVGVRAVSTFDGTYRKLINFSLTRVNTLFYVVQISSTLSFMIAISRFREFHVCVALIK